MAAPMAKSSQLIPLQQISSGALLGVDAPRNYIMDRSQITTLKQSIEQDIITILCCSLATGNFSFLSFKDVWKSFDCSAWNIVNEKSAHIQDQITQTLFELSMNQLHELPTLRMSEHLNNECMVYILMEAIWNTQVIFFIYCLHQTQVGYLHPIRISPASLLELHLATKRIISVSEIVDDLRYLGGFKDGIAAFHDLIESNSFLFCTSPGPIELSHSDAKYRGRSKSKSLNAIANESLTLMKQITEQLNVKSLLESAISTVRKWHVSTIPYPRSTAAVTSSNAHLRYLTANIPFGPPIAAITSINDVDANDIALRRQLREDQRQYLMQRRDEQQRKVVEQRARARQTLLLRPPFSLPSQGAVKKSNKKKAGKGKAKSGTSLHANRARKEASTSSDTTNTTDQSDSDSEEKWSSDPKSVAKKTIMSTRANTGAATSGSNRSSARIITSSKLVDLTSCNIDDLERLLDNDDHGVRALPLPLPLPLSMTSSADSSSKTAVDFYRDEDDENAWLRAMDNVDAAETCTISSTNDHNGNNFNEKSSISSQPEPSSDRVCSAGRGRARTRGGGRGCGSGRGRGRGRITNSTAGDSNGKDVLAALEQQLREVAAACDDDGDSDSASISRRATATRRGSRASATGSSDIAAAAAGGIDVLVALEQQLQEIAPGNCNLLPAGRAKRKRAVSVKNTSNTSNAGAGVVDMASLAVLEELERQTSEVESEHEVCSSSSTRRYNKTRTKTGTAATVASAVRRGRSTRNNDNNHDKEAMPAASAEGLDELAALEQQVQDVTGASSSAAGGSTSAATTRRSSSVAAGGLKKATQVQSKRVTRKNKKNHEVIPAITTHIASSDEPVSQAHESDAMTLLLQLEQQLQEYNETSLSL